MTQTVEDEDDQLAIAEAVLEMRDATGAIDVALLHERFPGSAAQIEHCLAGLAAYDTELLANRQVFGGFEEPLAPETRLGDFKLEQVIGGGAMGVVYRARQISMGERLVALKVLRRSLIAKDPRFVERFRREASLAAQLQSTGVATILGFGEDGGHVFLAMQLVGGLTLAEVITGLSAQRKAGASPHTSRAFVRIAVQVCIQIARALHTIHGAKMIHRDVKPSNIILAGAEDLATALECEPVLVDFGLLRSIEASDLTGSRTLVGTPAYASPEARLGRNVDQRSDVFSLGAVLHDLLGLTQCAERDAAAAGLIDVRTLNEFVDVRLAAIVRMAVEENAELRYGSCLELERDLERYLNDRPVKALPSAPVPRLRLWVRRSPGNAMRVTGWIAFTFVLLFGVIGSGYGFVQARERLSQARILQASGELPAAGEAWRRAGLDLRLFAWQATTEEETLVANLERGLSDRRQTEYEGDARVGIELGLAQVYLDLSTGDQAGFERAHDHVLMLLATQGHQTVRATLLGFLRRELLPDRPKWRRELAASSTAELALCHPTILESGALLDAPTAALRDTLLATAASDETRRVVRLAIASLSGLADDETHAGLVALNVDDDLEALRIKLLALARIAHSRFSEGELMAPDQLRAALDVSWAFFMNKETHASFQSPQPSERDAWPYLVYWEPMVRVADAVMENVNFALVMWYQAERLLVTGTGPRGLPATEAEFKRAAELLAYMSSDAFPLELRAFLGAAVERLLAHDRGAALPNKAVRLADLYRRIESGSALLEQLRRRDASKQPYFDIDALDQLEMGAGVVRYTNIWNVRLANGPAEYNAQAPDLQGKQARFGFEGSRPIFQGTAQAVRWDAAAIVPEGELKLIGDHSYLELRAPRHAWFEAEAVIPPDTQLARVRIHHVMANRLLMPFMGSSDARIRFNDKTEYRLPIDTRSALQTTDPQLGHIAQSDFLVNAADLADSKVLTIRYEHASGPNLIWLHSIYVQFYNEPFSLWER